VSVDLQTNIVAVEPARDRVLDLAAVPRAIRETGYRPGSMRLRARGAFVPLDGGRGFLVAGWPKAFPAVGDLPAGDGPVTIEAAVEVDGGGVRLRQLRPPAAR